MHGQRERPGLAGAHESKGHGPRRSGGGRGATIDPCAWKTPATPPLGRHCRATLRASSSSSRSSRRDRPPDGSGESRPRHLLGGGAVGCEQSPTREAPVRLQVKGKNVEVSDTLKAYAEEARQARQAPQRCGAARGGAAVEKNPSIAESQIAEARSDEGPSAPRARELVRHARLDRPAREKLERRRSVIATSGGRAVAAGTRPSWSRYPSSPTRRPP